MSDQSVKKVKPSEKVNCNVCDKELCKNSIKKHMEICDVCEVEFCKNSLKRHKENDHNVVNTLKKKEITPKKKEETSKKNESNDHNEENMLRTIWSKVWFGNEGDAPLQSTQDIEKDMDEYYMAPEEPITTVSADEIDHLLCEKEDSLLNVALEMDNNMDGEDDWINQTNPFSSQLGQEMRRQSLQEARSCKDCKTATKELNSLRNQYNKLLIHSNNRMKAAEVQKDFLRTQTKQAQDETERNKEKWVQDVEKASEEIEQYKMLLAEKVKENMEMSKQLNIEQSPNESHENESNKTKNAKDADGDIQTFYCRACKFTSTTLVALRGHVKFVHLLCQDCNTYYKSIPELKRHIRTDHPAKSRTCEQCKLLFQNRNTLELHMKKRHSKTYTCQVCQEKFEHKNEMMKHMKNSHTERTSRLEVTKFTCIMCVHEETSEEELVKHLANVHNLVDMDIQSRQEPVKFDCPLCKHSESLEELLVKHLEKVHHLADNPSSSRAKTTQLKPNQTVPRCMNGPSCRFLRNNRCNYFHDEAAQPEEGWQEVRPRQAKHKSQQYHHQEQQPRHHQHQQKLQTQQQVHGERSDVQWCWQELRCTRGRSCRFKHPAGRPGFVIIRRKVTMEDFPPEMSQRMRN